MKLRLSLVLSICCVSLLAQDPARFAEEVSKFANTASQYPSSKRIVFTGSSSIRLWTDFKAYFPNHNVINTGFGGSETSDLIHFRSLLIDQYQPQQIFIYEGDNDLNAGKSVQATLNDLKRLMKGLQEDGYRDIVIISAKPSIARWPLKAEYEELNQSLERFCQQIDGIRFADIWTPMLKAGGQLKQDLFIEDGLHMNKKGYDIWIKVIEPLLIK